MASLSPPVDSLLQLRDPPLDGALLLLHVLPVHVADLASGGLGLLPDRLQLGVSVAFAVFTNLSDLGKFLVDRHAGAAVEGLERPGDCSTVPLWISIYVSAFLIFKLKCKMVLKLREPRPLETYFEYLRIED